MTHSTTLDAVDPGYVTALRSREGWDWFFQVERNSARL
jgi:hypothetical protein